MKAKILFLLGFTSLLVPFFSCNYEQPGIPVVPVDIELNLNDPQYFELKSSGNFVYITGGVNGIIVYRKSSDEFCAYERTCPHDPDCGRVTVDADVFFAQDTVCCNSKFSLDVDGAVVSGDSKFPLRMYSVSYSANQNRIWIKN